MSTLTVIGKDVRGGKRTKTLRLSLAGLRVKVVTRLRSANLPIMAA
jgi:hypothetical protein